MNEEEKGEKEEGEEGEEGGGDEKEELEEEQGKNAHVASRPNLHRSGQPAAVASECRMWCQRAAKEQHSGVCRYPRALRQLALAGLPGLRDLCHCNSSSTAQHSTAHLLSLVLGSFSCHAPMHQLQRGSSGAARRSLKGRKTVLATHCALPCCTDVDQSSIHHSILIVFVSPPLHHSSYNKQPPAAVMYVAVSSLL